MKKVVFDIEADGLLDKATKIHCFCYCDVETGQSGSFVSYKDITEFLSNKEISLVGHNIVRYDIPLIEKLLGIKVQNTLIDTLPLSWTLFPQNVKHGLEEWGEFFGIKKPEIKDWSGLSSEKYIHRCTEDVKINVKLWKKQLSLMKQLYSEDSEIERYCAYLSFKMDCVKEQETIGIALDEEHCSKTLKALVREKEHKVEELKKAMPQNPIKKKKVYKDAITDKNGNVFTKGDLFFSSIDTEMMPKTIEKEIIVGYEDPNPNSVSQIKNWLYSLGWVPSNIKHVRDKVTNEVKKIPQVASKFVPGEVCESVQKLFEKEPKLEVLNGLSVISHRIGIFEGFLEEEKNGRLYPTCMGLTNTLRLQHAVVVNLPGVLKKYGTDVRKCLVADSGKMLCGSDLSGIEDNTKRHYIYKYDPKYVEEMSIPGYDPHLEIAMLAGFLTKEQVEEHKLYDATKGAEGKSHKSERQKAKTVNFSATYKVGAPTLSINAGISLKEAKKLLEIYWKRNDAILKVEKSLKIKELFGQKWLLNPVSGFWYSLRADKDKFSTLNQGTAVYVFDTWLKYIRKSGIQISYQCHDEWLANVRNEVETEHVIQQAIKKVNEELKLNVKIGCSVEFGKNYADCH